MRNEETNGNNGVATHIIDEFRATTPTPSEQDWMSLIATHPEFAGEIADAALLDRTTEHLEEADLGAPLDQSVFDSGVSRAINMLHEKPSAALCEAQEKIAAVQGTDVRALARDAGLGSASVLLSGVLVGTIEAPRKLVDFLAVKWGSTAVVLRECFRRAGASATVPAFKAQMRKPGLPTRPTPWAEAVKSLKLSEQETQRLLQLQD
jgi:hypothetical protein